MTKPKHLYVPPEERAGNQVRTPALPLFTNHSQSKRVYLQPTNTALTTSQQLSMAVEKLGKVMILAAPMTTWRSMSSSTVRSSFQTHQLNWTEKTNNSRSNRLFRNWVWETPLPHNHFTVRTIWLRIGTLAISSSSIRSRRRVIELRTALTRQRLPLQLRLTFPSPKRRRTNNSLPLWNRQTRSISRTTESLLWWRVK